MKKLFILTITAAFFFAACSDSGSDPKKDDNTSNVDPSSFSVPEDNTAILVKFTGTNCPPCGSWGWATFAELIANSAGDAIPFSAYSSNPFAEHMINAESSAMDDAQGVTGYPSFSVGDALQLSRDGGSVNVTKEKQMCYDAIAAHNGAPVEMNATVKYKIQDGKVKIYYKVKAFKDMPENNYLALYVLEDKVTQYQAGHSEGVNAVHKHVLRKGINGAWGLNIGPMTSGQTKSGTEEMTIGEDYSTGLKWASEHIEVVGVMRFNLGSVNVFINACEGEKLN